MALIRDFGTQLILAVATAIVFAAGFLVGQATAAPRWAAHPVTPSVFESAAPQLHTLGAGDGQPSEAPTGRIGRVTPTQVSGASSPAASSVGPSPVAAGEQPTAMDPGSGSAAASVPGETVGPSPVLVGKTLPEMDAGSRVIGLSSWYCRPGRSICTRGYPASGPYAAAGPALRVGAWRGRWVTVTAAGTTIRVRLVDWCACSGGKVIDLYASQFAKLAPLSRGVVSVRVTW